MIADRNNPGFRRRFSAWAQLLRLPNLLTVPGDAVVGYLIAANLFGQSVDPLALAAAGLASLCLYAFGLVQNDLVDARLDAAERPRRPIPAGDVSKPAAAIGGCLLLAAAFVIALAMTFTVSPTVMAITGCLVAAISSYNVFLKRRRILGPLAMGACRALSFLLGAAIAGWAWTVNWPLILPAAALLLYIAAVTAIAAGEASRRKLGLLAWGPLAVLAPTMFAIVIFTFRRFGSASLPPWLAVYLLAWTLTRTAYFAAAIRGRVEPRVVQAAVGHMIRGLLMLQAAFAVALASLEAGLAVFVVTFVALPVANFLGRRFYAS